MLAMVRAWIASLPERWRAYRLSAIEPELALREDGVWLRCKPPSLTQAVMISAMYLFFLVTYALGSGPNSWLGLAILAVIASLAFVPLVITLVVIPGYEARIADGEVRVSLRRHIPIAQHEWAEPLSAYRGLLARTARWTDPPPTYDDVRINPSRYGSDHAPVWKSDPSEARRRRAGELLLEHKTDPERTLLLARTPDKAIRTAFAQDVAARIGLPFRWTP